MLNLARRNGFFGGKEEIEETDLQFVHIFQEHPTNQFV